MRTGVILTIVWVMLGIVSDVSGVLVAHYEFEGNANDSSGNGHDGVFFGDPRWVDGRSGSALEFDGDDYLDTGSTDYLGTWTIACWVMSPTAPTPGAASGPVHREANYHFNWNHGFAERRGTVCMRIGSQWYSASLQPLEANTWYHIAGTYDGEELKAYRNGSLVETNDDASGPPAQEKNSLKIGRHAQVENDYFIGTVDDVRIYDHALDADEIAELAAVASAGIDIRIADANDDVEQHLNTGRVYLDSDDLELVHEPGGTRSLPPGEQIVGLRFIHVQLSRGSVSEAHLEFTANKTLGDSHPVHLVIEGLLVPNAEPFTRDSNNVTSRSPWTAAKVKWPVPELTVVGERFRTPNIAPIIEEIITQETWKSGNALILAIRDDKDNPSTGVRVAESFEGGVSLAPLLHIEQNPLIAHWRFDERTGDIAIDSAGVFDGVVFGATRTTTGVAAGALRFAGPDTLVDCGTDAALTPESLTVSAWVKPDDLSSRQSIVHKGGDLFDADLDVAIYFDRVRFQFGDGNDFMSVRSNSTIVPGEWTMISGTRNASENGSEAAVYINGVRDDSESYFFRAIAGVLPLVISGPAGEVDDVRVYRKALREKELLELYVTTPESQDPNLVGHWALDDGIGHIASDSVGGCDGVVQGAIWTTGILDGALSFDGVDDVVNCGSDAALSPEVLTISAWVRPQDTSSRRSIVHKGGPPSHSSTSTVPEPSYAYPYERPVRPSTYSTWTCPLMNAPVPVPRRHSHSYRP